MCVKLDTNWNARRYLTAAILLLFTWFMMSYKNLKKQKAIKIFQKIIPVSHWNSRLSYRLWKSIILKISQIILKLCLQAIKLTYYYVLSKIIVNWQIIIIWCHAIAFDQYLIGGGGRIRRLTCIVAHCPANTQHWSSLALMLNHCLLICANISMKPGQGHMFSGCSLIERLTIS